MENLRIRKYTSVYDYDYLLLHKNFSQTTSSSDLSYKQCSGTTESNNFTEYSTIQEVSLQRNVGAVDIVVLLFAVYGCGTFRVSSH